MKDIKNKKIKIIILTIVLLFIAVPTVMINTGALQQISAFLFGSQDNLFEYAIIDNRDENKISVLATISAENELEYVEKDDGTVINANGSKTLSLDFIMSKDEQKEVKIKEKGKGLVTKTIILNDDVIKNTALDLITDFEIDGYKTLSISKNDNFPSDYSKITYQIGKNGTWYNYNGSFSIVDYDIYENKLDNLDNTLTVTAKITNTKTSCEVSLSKDYNIISPGYENEPITADSLLKAAENITDTGTYNITVNDQMYTTRVYCFNEDMDITANTSFGTEKDVSTGGNAKNMIIVKVNGDLTNSAYLTSYASKNGYGGPKGMFIYCTGDLTNSGTISMTARGARAPGQNVYLWKNADETYEYVPAVGGAGGTSVYRGDGGVAGNPGNSGVNRQTGGGAAGACYGNGYYRVPGINGSGGNGTSYSGGTGGGAADQGTATSGSSEGGMGGNAGISNWAGGRPIAGGGAGNPGGYGARGGARGANGTGGLLIIYAENVTNNNTIDSRGSNGGSGNNWGGGSGGGSINIFFTGTYSNTGTINTAGGTGGGTGGTGSISIGKIVDGSYIDNEKIYKITYDPNGGTGFMKTSEGVNSVTVAENEFTSPTTEKFFLSWNTKADRSGTTYKPGDTLSSNETLYAIWGSANYTKGEMVTLGTGENAENFYVVANTDASSPTVTLLTEKCVNTSDYKQSNSYNTVKFDDSSNNYNRPSYIKGLVDNGYVPAFESRTGITVQEARLLSKSEAEALSTDIRYGTTTKWNYWLGSPYEGYARIVWIVDSSDNGDVPYNDVSYGGHFGLRPVLIVLKSDI